MSPIDTLCWVKLKKVTVVTTKRAYELYKDRSLFARFRNAHAASGTRTPFPRRPSGSCTPRNVGDQPLPSSTLTSAASIQAFVPTPCVRAAI